ncbi:uncharacterized protein LOC119082138 isoform X2 [Bradysia coprophila]|nr:uncharacterized protein LOC119082138 isoform X2 [Bradysia coprophila]
MKRTSQHCWRKDACQKVNCKFIHPRGTPQYCWQKDACVKDNCKFIHPRDSNSQCSSLDNNPKPEGAECLQSNDGNVHSSPVECGTTSSTRSKETPSRANVEMVIGIGKENESSTDFEQRRQTVYKVRSVPTMVFYGTKSQVDSASCNSVPTPPMQSELKSTDVDIVRHSLTNSSDTHVSATGTGKQSVRVWKKSEPKETGSVVEPLHNSNLSKAGKRGNRKKSAKVPEIQLKSIGGNSDPIQSIDVSNSGLQLPDVVDISKVKRAPKTNSYRDGSSRSHSHRESSQQRGLNMNGCASAQSITPIQPEWNSDEAMAIVQHRHIIDGINDRISQIILSEDYSTNYEKHEASIRILRDNLVEMESHVSIYDSVKSRACRELSYRPTELRNQIYREIYRLKCRLGAFSKRLDMEKYFGSGDRFLIVQGETGSGKSTQIPQYVADHPRFYGKKIICTQPRKLAAISLARRVAFEYSGGIVRNSLSSYIGYQVGGDKRPNRGCRIEFVTEGIMLERIMDGSMESFKDVGCIIVDEAHLRSITCDLLLGSFRKPDPRWKDTLVIITSATIDLTLFAQFFYNAPTVQIEGRTFPVDIIYQPAADESNIQRAVSECALQIHLNCRSAPGDILCFLPGLEDITNAKAIFEKELKKVSARKSDRLDAVVFMLYGKQDPDKQAEVFEKLDVAKERKIIFATDIAETSITIDGVVYVVDSGIRKEIVFDSERNISSLKINAISKSSAIQRSGRCGRTQPGVCYRLYSQDEFESMNINAAPEVLCRPISLAVLTLLELSLDPQKFDWISPPSTEAIVNAEKELIILGAVDLQRKPTELGNLIAKCQQDPKIMKIVYDGCVRGLGEAACNVAAILSVSSMFFWNGNDAETKAKALQMRKKFAMPEGDIVTMYRIFEEFNSIYNGRPMKKSNDSEGTAVRKPASVWCNDNSLNAKSMFMAVDTKVELMNRLKRTKIWSKSSNQNQLASNSDVQELMCSGFFIQCARVFYSKNHRAPVEYFSAESGVTGRLDFRSSLNLLDIEAPPPKWIVYDKIVRLPSTIFPVASVMDENWLKDTHNGFYMTCLKKTEDLPTHLIEMSISQVSFRMIVGRNFCNVDALEKELGCLVTGDADTGVMHLYCAPVRSLMVERQIRSKIDDALMEIRNQVTDDSYIGETRVVIGEGYEVHEILFEKEFSTFYVKDVNAEQFDKATLKYFLTINGERLASLDYTDYGKTYTAVAKFKSKKDAQASYDRFCKAGEFSVSPSFGSTNGIRHGLNCRLKLTWPTARSKGVAHIFFNEADDANRFLDNVQHIYPNTVVHVAGETQRSKQRNSQLKSQGPRPPLTYVKRQGCAFRFDLAAIAGMPDRRKLNYKVTLVGLQLRVDKAELTSTLAAYDLKDVIVEYENFTAPDSGNGLTPDEKSIKLKHLNRFMDTATKTSDFFKRNTGVAGICVFFTSNSTAKQAYNYAKAKYDSMITDPSLGPHRLDIEYTHTMSIQIGLYTFLQPQIEALQKEARTKRFTCSTTPVQDNTKTVILKFNTSKHSLLGWIEAQFDELVRPTKFDCPHSDVLFTGTGRLEMMKLAKNTYVNVSDDTQIIWVYGDAEVKDKSCKEIERLANRLHALDVLDKEVWLKRTVRINDKEGRIITNKCREEKIDFHRFHGNRIYISGSQRSVDAMCTFFAQRKYSWDRTKANRFKLDKSRECGLCFEAPESAFIMLSVCSHIFCSDCIEPMVNMQPPPFPVKCPVCDQFVALHDIKKLAPTKSLEKVLELAVKSFQQSHSHDIRQCPQPGCHQLLNYESRTAGTHGGDFLFCDNCINTYCIACSEKMEKPVRSHDDDSCENIQNGVSNLVHKHVRAIQETVLNLSCPKCNTAFYEFDGCVAVTCSTCKAGFCGLCLANCGSDAHSHVRSCPKNPGTDYYVSQRDLQAVHLDMRNRKLRDYLSQHRLNSTVHRQIIEKIRPDLIDLKMTVPEATADAHDGPVAETSDAVMRHVRKIQEEILTLSCPHCKVAFFDFDGCAAVSCYSCRREFCGLCLEHTDGIILEHVVRCQRNPATGNYFLRSAELSRIHAAVRTDRIQSYFNDKLGDTATKEQVLALIRVDLVDLQVKLPEINVRQQRVRPAVPFHIQQLMEERRLERLMQDEPVRRAVPLRQPVPPAQPNRRPAPQPPRRDCCIL